MLEELLRELAGKTSAERNGTGQGKRKGRLPKRQGIHRGYTLSGKVPEDPVDFSATLRAAAPHQKALREDRDCQNAVILQPGYLRYRRFANREKTGILFVVDGSRSQGANQRLAFAKGALLSLLEQAYCRRDHVGLIVFGDKKAQLVLPFTRSVEFAAKKLEGLTAAGNTPLAMGMRKAIAAAAAGKQKSAFGDVLLVVVTDGRANYDVREGKPFALALEAAEQIRLAQLPAVVIDTDRGPFRLGMAKKLAERMDARYLSL